MTANAIAEYPPEVVTNADKADWHDMLADRAAEEFAEHYAKADRFRRLAEIDDNRVFPRVVEEAEHAGA